MRNCPCCSSRFRFVDVLKAVNPARIKCSRCGQRVAVNSSHAIAGSIAAGAVSLVLVGLGVQVGLPGPLLLLALLAAGLLVEAVYYALIVNGTIGTRIVAAKPSV